MKAFRKLFALLMAMLMTMSLLATTAVAAGNRTITIKNTVANHTYKAYQIFSGTVDSKGVMNNVDWGTGVNPEALVTALKSDTLIVNYPALKNASNQNPFSGLAAYDNGNTSASAEAVLGIMTDKWQYNEPEIKAFADVLSNYLTTTESNIHGSTFKNGAHVIEIPGPGYYLIVDTWSSDNIPSDGATDYLLLLTLNNDASNANNTNVEIKVSKPTFTKTVHTSLEGTYSSFVDSEISDADLDSIKDGDTVNPSKLKELTTSNAVWFKLEATLPSLFRDYHQYHLVFEDILPAGLTPVPGSSYGNIYLLHEGGRKTLLNAETKIENHSDGTKVSLDLGDIIEQLKTVTFNLNDTIVIKYAATLEPGAKLGRSGNGNVNTATMRYSNDMNQPADTPVANIKWGELESSAGVHTYQAIFTKVDSATQAPLPNAEFVLYRNRTEKYTDTNDSQEKEHLVKYYAIVNASPTDLSDPTKDYITDWTTNKAAATVLKSGANGQFTVKGLDTLNYHLEEITPPDGYTKLKQPVLVNIEVVVKDSLPTLQMSIDGTTVTGTIETGTVTGNINNTPGKVLPSTGGMGTTIFYIVGAALVLGAGAAFVMKKRNEA